MQHLLLKTSNDIVITDYATMFRFLWQVSSFWQEKGSTSTWIFCFPPPRPYIWNRHLQQKHPELTVEEEEETFWGREKKAKQSEEKASEAKRGSKSLQLQYSHPPNSRPALSPVRPGRLPTYYLLKEPAQQKQRALYQYVAHPSHLQCLVSPPIPAHEPDCIKWESI